jgi:hypothetical protein
VRETHCGFETAPTHIVHVNTMVKYATWYTGSMGVGNYELSGVD